MSVDLLSQLNPEQTQAVTHQQGPALVLAGAGSGKTKVLTTRAAWLMQEQQIGSEQILLVTFTNKAAGEMRSRVEKLTSQHLVWSGTFHSLCARILRYDGHHIGLPTGFSIYDTDDQLSLIKQIYKELDLSVKEFNPKSVRAAISQAKNELISVSQYQDTAYGRFAELVSRVYKVYTHKLEQIGAADFDDLMLKVIQLYTQNPNVLAKYQQIFQHVLVDEYQDTNKAQYQLTRFFAQPQQNLFVVGDFSQSIYAWRGADYRNMLQIKTDFPKISEYRLERNYRSTQTILDAATQVISLNTSHPVLSLWTEKTAQEPIQIFEAKDGIEEAQFVTSQISQLKSDYSLSEMAILYRTNAQSREFEEALIKAHLPYRIIGGLKFYERKEIKDLLAYLKYLANSRDEVSYQRITKLGKRVLETFSQWQQKILQSYQLSALNPKTTLQEIIDITHFTDKFDAKDLEDANRLENIDELLRVAAQFDDINQFLENIALIQNDYLPDQINGDNPQAISLMSLHAAKGLEFEIVFMAGMEEGLLPHSRSYLDKNQLEEERRLCYVGITRAKAKLFMSYRSWHQEYGQGGYRSRSRFINDIDTSLTNFINTSNHQSVAVTNHNYESRRIISDDELEMVLNGELDVAEFLKNK